MTLPATVIVSEGSPADHPEVWKRAAEGGSIVVALQERSAIAKRFETFITPHLFVVGPDGRVLAQGIASNVEEVKAVTRRAKRERRVLEVAGGNVGRTE
jgi:hypothetical protein